MKIQKWSIRCAVCGHESEQDIVMSHSSFGYPDFDMKPSGSMLKIGSNIQECPYCHYCNYDITTTIERRFTSNPKLWMESECFKHFMESEETNPELFRRSEAVAMQYKNNGEYKKYYRELLNMFWIMEDLDKSEIEGDFEEDKKILRNHLIENYRDHILDEQLDQLLQYADILRMNSNFEEAQKVINSIELLSFRKSEDFSKIIEKEKEYIEDMDSERHNLSEVFDF